MSSNLSRLQQIFRDQLDTPNLVLAETSTPDQIEGWDSLATIRIVVATEEEFGVQFDAAQIEGVKSVADLLRAIETASA